VFWRDLILESSSRQTGSEVQKRQILVERNTERAELKAGTLEGSTFSEPPLLHLIVFLGLKR
jgi:hypothetical protein